MLTLVCSLLLLAGCMGQFGFNTCSKPYGPYFLITDPGIQYSTVNDVCNSFGAAPASIDSQNWSSLINLYTWCSIGATPFGISYPWVAGQQIAGNCPVLTSVDGSLVLTTTVPCDSSQARPLLCQSVAVRTITQVTTDTVLVAIPVTVSVTTRFTTTLVSVTTFTAETTTVTTFLTASITTTQIDADNTATVSRSVLETVSVESTDLQTATTTVTSGTTTRTLISLRPRTATVSTSTRVTVTSPTLTAVSCIEGA